MLVSFIIAVLTVVAGIWAAKKLKVIQAVSEAAAQRSVLGMLLVVSAVVAWDNIKRTGKATPSGKSLVAFVILGAGLAVGAGLAPGVVGPLALLIGLSIVISRSANWKKA